MQSKSIDITIIECPKCGKEIHAFMDKEPAYCPECEASLSNAECHTAEVVVYLYHEGTVEGEVA